MKEIFSYQQLLLTIRDVLISPVSFWAIKKNEESGHRKLLGTYYLPLVAIASFAVFLGTWISSTHFYIGFAILKAIREIVLFSLLYFICSFLVSQLFKTFDGEKNIGTSRQLVAYSLTPFLLGSIVSGLFPALYVVEVLGLYGVYIFAVGVNELEVVPKIKQSRYILMSLLLCLFVFGFLSVLLWKLFLAYY